MNPERERRYRCVMEQMRQAQHKLVSGHQEKLGTFREASFHRNTSPVAFGGWREVERVTRDVVVFVCVCGGGAVYGIKCSHNMTQRGRERWDERKGIRAPMQHLHLILSRF